MKDKCYITSKGLRVRASRKLTKEEEAALDNLFEAAYTYMAKHPGFKAVQKSIQKEGYSKESAGAILASKTRNASKAAHKANPRLNRVKG